MEFLVNSILTFNSVSVAFLLAFTANSLLAGSTTFFYNGTKLYNLCRSEKPLDEALCEGYILGVQDAIYSGHLSDHFSLCLEEGVEPDQMRLQLLRFIENNPDIMHFAAEGLVAKSLETSYACKN